MIKLIAIEGSVAVGKSTLIQKLKSYKPIADKVLFIDEPVSEFSSYVSENDKKFNPLKEQYDDSRNFPIVQMHIIKALAKQLDSSSLTNKKFIISERSLLSPMVFIDVQSKLNNITPFTARYLLDECSNAVKTCHTKNNIKLHGVFLIDIPVENCLSRINGRAREGEDNINKQFMCTLQQSYKEYFEHWGQQLSNNAVRLTHETDRTEVFSEFFEYFNNILNQEED